MPRLVTESVNKRVPYITLHIRYVIEILSIVGCVGIGAYSWLAMPRKKKNSKTIQCCAPINLKAAGGGGKEEAGHGLGI